jgi:hypothetical protein
MSGNVFLLHEDGRLVQMQERYYDSESLLQQLLADYPDLLAGSQINEAAPRRWLLVSREAPLAAEPDAAARWSVDHLFLDQDAVPTLVEVKRSGDTRIRREVIGQMLDYAANAVVHWSVEAIRSKFEVTCQCRGQDAASLISEFLGPDRESEQFWADVKTNLQAGKLRLVFVADAIPRELQRVVEFLNQQMDPAEVLAIEVKQYQGQGLKTLVPRVVGQSSRKPGGETQTRQWDEGTFFAELEHKCGQDVAATARHIYEWARYQLPHFWWGKGTRDGSFVPLLERNGIQYYPVVMWTYGRIELQFQHLKSRPPFDDLEKRREFLRRVNEATGQTIPDNSLEKRPSFPLSALSDKGVMHAFLAALDWFVAQIEGQ